MAGDDGVVRPIEKDSKQRTLFDLQKVVRLDTSAVCFSAEAVQQLKKMLLDPTTPKWQLLETLRKLDCFRFELSSLVSTEVGQAVATLKQHPKVEVAKLSHNLVNKWRALIDDALFKQLAYDCDMAATIPEDPPAPPPAPPEQAAQQAADRQELRRQQELDFLLTDSEEEEEEPSQEDPDDDWRPGRGSKRQSSKRKQKQKG